MPTDLVKFYTNSFDPLNFYEYLLQKNIDDYEEQNQDVKVRDNRALFKYAVLMTLNEANKHYSKHGRKSFFWTRWEKIIIDQFEDLKKEFVENHFIMAQTKKDVVFLLKNNTSEVILVK